LARGDHELLTAADAAIATMLSLATHRGHPPTEEETAMVLQMVRSGLRSLASQTSDRI
jgi:hypothetical protein